MINITVGGVAYPVPSSAADTNWAAQQIAFQKALAAAAGSAVNAGVISAASYGVSPDNDGDTNNAAMIPAIAAAVAAGQELLLPPGDLDLGMHAQPSTAGLPGAAALVASVTIRGAGTDATVLVSDGWVEPTYSGPVTIISQNDNATAMIAIAPGLNVNIKLADMTLRGPPEADLTHALSNVWGIYCGGGGSLTLERVNFENFNQSIKLSPNYPAFPGAGTRFVMFDCYDQFRGTGVLHEAATGSEDFDDQLKCRHRYQSNLAALISQLPTISAACHCLYISNGVSLRTIQNTYEETGGSGGESGCAWRHYSVGDAEVPKYSESIGDVFLSGCAAAIIPNPNFVSTIQDPTIHTADRSGNTAIQTPGPVIIDGLHMIGASASSFGISDGAFTSGRVSVSNSVIEGDWLYPLSRVNDAADRWKIGPNVEFRCTSSGGGGGVRILGGGLDIDGALFDVTGGGTGASMFLKGGSVRMGNTRFSSGCKYMVISADQANLSVEFLPGNLSELATRPMFVTPEAFIATLAGDAGWLGDLGFTLSTAPSSQLNGSLQVAQGVGTYTASGASPNVALTLAWDGDTFVIDQAAGPTIDSIHMAGAIAGGAVVNDLNAPCQATVKLYVKQAFTLGNTGNIVAAGGARTVGAIVTLTYMNTIATPAWVEV